MLETFFIPAFVFAFVWFLFVVVIQGKGIQVGLIRALYFVGWYAFGWLLFDLLCRLSIICAGRFNEAN